MRSAFDSLNRLTAQTPGGAIVVAGSLNEPGSVTISGIPAALDSTNNFRGTFSTTIGTNAFTIVAKDASGNITTQDYEFELTGAASTRTFDAAGNLTESGTETKEWNAENQITAVSLGTQRIEYSYDGLGRRIREVVKVSSQVQSDTSFVWCGNRRCEERVNGSVTRRMFADGEQVNATIQFITTDHLGSVTDVTASIGTRLAAYTYDAWGRQTLLSGSDVSNIGFTGHYKDSASGSRWAAMYRTYDAELGMWLSEDHIGFEDGPNLYSYVHGRPVSYQDELGLYSTAPLPPPAAAVAAAAIAGWFVGSWIDRNIIAPPKSPKLLPPANPKSPSRRKGNDPIVYPEEYEVNPGRVGSGANCGCRPCPPNQYWPQQGKPGAHGAADGIHWHGLVWNQDPVTCICRWKRTSFKDKPF